MTRSRRWALRAAIVCLLCWPGRPSAAARVFLGVFAPQADLVAAIERPYRDDLCLDGLWQFQAAPLPSGFQIGIYPAPPLPDPRPDAWDPVPLRIPSPWNVNGFTREGATFEGGDFCCFPSYPRAWEDVRMAWMRKRVTVPAEWAGNRVRLRFGAIAGDAVVRVNGLEVGRHFDLFLPFEMDVTSAVKFGGENEILVGVRRADLFNHITGKMGYRPYPGGSFWGPFAAGIWQDAYLEAVPPVHAADVFVQPRVDRGTLQVELEIRNDTDQAAEVTVQGEVRPWTNRAGTDVLSAPVPAGSLGDPVLSVPAATARIPASASAKVALIAPVQDRLRPWSPDHPRLYGLILRLGSGDVRFVRFGWRQLTIAGQTLLLNGRPIVLKGDAWHFMGIPQMTRRYAWGWYTALKAAGLNAVRLHAQPYPPLYLDMADEMGVLVLDESGIWASDGGPQVDSPDFWTRCSHHVRDLVLRDRNHPCVFGWGVENELLGVVRGVYHAPGDVQDRVVDQVATWAAICRALDPTRPWISADGDGDVRGRLPVAVVHYPDERLMRRLAAGRKPWAVGESGRAYDGTPRDVSAFNGERAYASMEGRMEGLAYEAYRLLGEQRRLGASGSSVFNLVWYGLQPLALGMDDTSRPFRAGDGIFFSRFQEGQPGVQPERLGPYCTTLNPGYDPIRPLYRPWPLFDGIRDGFAGDAASRWARSPPSVPPPVPPPAAIDRVAVRAGPASDLAALWRRWGVPVSAREGAGLLVIDGAAPPPAALRPQVDAMLARGGTVLVWGAARGSLAGLSRLLPDALALTDRQASSLVPTAADPLVSGLVPSLLYFSESSREGGGSTGRPIAGEPAPVLALNGGLDGPLVRRGTVLLQACGTDWRRWNGRPEDVKTASVLLSEREAKPGGAALVAVPVGPGRLVLAKLDAPPSLPQVKAVVTRLLRNLGVRMR